MTLQGAPRAALAAAALALLAAGCGSAGSSGTAGSDPGSAGGEGSPGARVLQEALAMLPADVTYVEVVDRDGAAERLGVGDVEPGADEAQVQEYLAAWNQDPVLPTPLAADLALAPDAPVTDLHVAWSATGGSGTPEEDGDEFEAYRLHDDVDLDAVAADLEQLGYAPEDRGDGVLLTAPDDLFDQTDGGQTLPGGYPLGWAGDEAVGIDADRHLLVVGGEAGSFLDVAAGEAEPVAGSGTFDALVEVAPGAGPDVQYAYLNAYDPCPLGLTTGDLGDDDVTLVEALGTAESAGYLASAESDDEGAAVTTSGALAFPDEPAARADLEARTTYLADGVSYRHGYPVTNLGTAELTVDGSTVRMLLDPAYPTADRRAALEADGFFLCS